MLKKCISLAIVCTMLAGLFVPAYADTAKTYAEYTMTDNVELATSGFTSYLDVPVYNGFRPGNTVTAKTGDTVYEVSTAGSSKYFMVGKSGISDTYTDGEKVHISTEMMVASGSSFRNPRLGGPGFEISVLPVAGSASTGSMGVASTIAPNTYRPNKVICFDHDNRITLFGGSVHTNMNWSYDKWHKIDVVIVMGASPKAAIYFDGQPLAVDVDYGNGVADKKDNPNDAVFDESKTTTDYIDIGCITASGFAPSAIYGVASFEVSGISYADAAAKATVYVDNLSYKAMSATDYPVIDSSLAIKGLADGATVDRAELGAVEVNVPQWFAHQTAKVAVSVDGAAALEDSSAPFTFDLSTVERGVRHLTLTAYDANGNAIKQAVKTLTVAGNEYQTLFYNDFEAANPFSDAPYGNSLFTNQVSPVATRSLTFEDVADSAGVTKRAAKMWSKGQPIRLSYTSEIAQTTGTVNISYDMYLDNADIASLRLCRNGEGYDIVNYSNGVYSTYNSTNGVTQAISFDAVIGYWQKWDWYLDFVKRTVTLKIDGKTKLNNVGMGADWSTADHFYKNFMISFTSAESKDSFIAVDNFSVNRYTGIPAVEYDMYDYNSHKSWSEYTIDQMYNLGILKDRSSVTAGDNSKIYAGTVKKADGSAPLNESYGDSIIAEFSSNDVYNSTSLAAAYSYNRGAYEPHYGAMTVEFDFYLDNTNHNGISWNLDSNTLVKIKAGESRIRLDPWGNYNTNYNITPGEWHRYKFEIEYNNGKQIYYVGMYVDGVRVYYTPIATTTYAAHNISKPSYFNFVLSPVANSGNYAANKMAIDNIKFEFDAVVPYISGADFGTENYANGLVKTSAQSAVVKVSGMPYSAKFADSTTNPADVSSKISLIDVDAGAAVSDVQVSAAYDITADDVINITLSNLSLEAGKKYKVLLDSGMSFDAGNSLATNEPSSFVFTAIDSFPTVASPDDGVEGNITVADVRFTTNSPVPLGENSLKGYNGGTIAAGKELRADVMVNNSAATAQTFRVVIATYDGSELTGISLGEECTVLPKAESMVFTSGKITISEAATPDIKVMILTDSNTIIPVSKAFSLDN